MRHLTLQFTLHRRTPTRFTLNGRGIWDDGETFTLEVHFLGPEVQRVPTVIQQLVACYRQQGYAVHVSREGVSA